MFLEAADVAGVSNVIIENLMELMLIDPRPIHGRNETFNTLGNPYWFFKEHYWCTYGNQVYDMLFMEEKKVAFYPLVREEIITPDPPGGDTERKPLNINVELYLNGCYVYYDENARKVFVAKDKHGIVEYVGNQKKHP